MKIVKGELTIIAAELAEYLELELGEDSIIPYGTTCAYFEINGEVLADNTEITIGYCELTDQYVEDYKIRKGKT